MTKLQNEILESFDDLAGDQVDMALASAEVAKKWIELAWEGAVKRRTIWTNTKVTYWFVAYCFARLIRLFFNLKKPKLTVSEFVNNPHHHLIEVIVGE